MHMIALAKAQVAPKPRSDSVRQIAVFYAGLLTAMAVTQLFTFEEFRNLVMAMGLPLPELAVAILVPVLIAAEVMALPFLLRMTLSPAFRWVSMAASWFVPLVWFFISCVIAHSYPVQDNVGFLGTVIALVPGWWAIQYSVLLAVMAGWVSWVQWSVRKAKKS